MRVLVVRPGPNFSVSDVHRGVVGGLKAVGCQVVDFNYDDRLNFYGAAWVKTEDGTYVKAFHDDDVMHVAAKGIEAACYEVWPDLVVFTSGFFVPPAVYELIRRRGAKVALLCTESPYEDDKQLTRAACVDYVFLNDPTNIARFREVNPNTWYLPHAYDPKVHRPGPVRPSLASDFVFVGTGYQSRIEFFEKVDWSGIDVALGGNWQQLDDLSSLRPFVAHDIAACVDNVDAVRMYRAAKVSANLYRRESERPELSVGWAMGPREVELAATGTFFLREPRGESDEVLWMLPTFTDPGDFEEQLRWWLARSEQRAEVARLAMGAVAGRTFEANAKRLLDHIESSVPCG